MKKIYLSISGLLCFAVCFSQIIAITSNPGISSSIVIGSSNYHASESIFLESEIGAANFTTAGTAITSVAFSCNAIGTGSTTVASPNYIIYFKDVPAATTTFATGA